HLVWAPGTTTAHLAWISSNHNLYFYGSIVRFRKVHKLCFIGDCIMLCDCLSTINLCPMARPTRPARLTYWTLGFSRRASLLLFRDKCRGACPAAMPRAWSSNTAVCLNSLSPAWVATARLSIST
ncbi:hypothetical protein COCMIDRAFT_107482, partial [Bipolaris oryzae ATCC 44560]